MRQFKIVALAVVAAAAPVAAQPAPAWDTALVATHPAFEFGDIKGHVITAKTVGCKTTLTLDSGQTYTLDLSQRGVTMGSMLMVGDGDATSGFTFQGDTARAAAVAAEKALAPISDRCAG